MAGGPIEITDDSNAAEIAFDKNATWIYCGISPFTGTALYCKAYDEGVMAASEILENFSLNCYSALKNPEGWRLPTSQELEHILATICDGANLELEFDKRGPSVIEYLSLDCNGDAFYTNAINLTQRLIYNRCGYVNFRLVRTD